MEKQKTVDMYLKGYNPEKRTHQIIISAIKDGRPQKPHCYISVVFQGTTKGLMDKIKKGLGINGDGTVEK